MIIVMLHVFAAILAAILDLFTNIVCKWYISDPLICGSTYNSTQKYVPK